MSSAYQNEEPKLDEKVFTAPARPLSCQHEFVRKDRNHVECKKCNFGVIDSPDRPFPIHN